MSQKGVGCLLAALGMLVLPGTVLAQCQSCGGGGACASSGCASGGCGAASCAAPACAPTYTTQTVYVPQMVKEKRIVSETISVPQQQMRAP